MGFALRDCLRAFVTLSTLQIQHFRNLSDVQFEFSPRFNLLFGENGAGKTGVLEAIYFLSLGKSFRSSHAEHLIQRDMHALSLFTRLNDGANLIPLGLMRSHDGLSQIRLNEKPVCSVSQVSQILPVQFIGPSTHRILTDGPKFRREFLDWGLFYTNARFFEGWKNFQKVLQHRNVLLKTHATKEEIFVWNQQISVYGESLHAMRVAYLDAFLPFFRSIMMVFLDDMKIELTYLPGWDLSYSLLEALQHNVSRETILGYTVFGPHRADLLISINGSPVQAILSQGQQKLVSYALRLAQGLHFQSVMNKAPIYLIDDLPSELDSHKQKLVARILNNICAQVFITAIKSDDLKSIFSENPVNKMFHVEHGTVSEAV